MTPARQRAIASLVIWLTILIAFTVIFFAGDGPDGYTAEQNRGRRVLVAGLFAGGFLLHAVVLWRTRSARLAAGSAYDERDEAVARQASATTLTVVMVFVFALSITLYEAYRARGAVPAGWLWYLAYGTAFVGFIGHAALTLVLDARSLNRG